MAAPFTIETTYPASSNLISQFPTHETQFRQTVYDWLSGLSDPTTGKLLFSSFPDVLPVANGGTGTDNLTDLKTSLALGALASKDQASLTADVTGVLPLANGGTGATTAAAARTTLGLGSAALASTTDFATAAQGTLATNAMPRSGGTFTGAVTFNSTVTIPSNLYSSTVNLVMGTTGAGTVYLRPNGPGSGTGQFYVTSSGAATFSGTVTAPQVTYSSDRRLKSNIRPIPNALARVLALGGYLYHRDDLDIESAGLIAQDARKVMPEMVHENSDGTLSIDPGPAIGLLVAAIKELYGDPSL